MDTELQEMSLIDRVKSYACSAAVLRAPWLELLMADVIDTLAAQEWQDISTAPKDMPVLGMNKHGDIGHTHWLEADDGAPACWWNDQDDDEWNPLWWMPCLPPMPDTLIADDRATAAQGTKP